MKLFFGGSSVISALLILIIFTVAKLAKVPEGFFPTAMAGVLLSLFFVAGGFILYVFALKFRQKAFNKVVGISILGRLFFMAVTIVSILLIFKPDQVVFLIAMFISYFLFQIWEVISFNKIAADKV